MATVYRLFSEDVWINWEDNGKTEVTEIIAEFLNNDDPGLSKPGVVEDLSRGLYEIIWAITKNAITVDQGKAFLKEIINMHKDMASQIVEVASLIDFETQAMEKEKVNRLNLLLLLKELDLDNLYKERLDLDTLGNAQVVKNKKIFHTKHIKVRTKMYYKQQKFNLLREESEGYAKLITDLNQEITEELTPLKMIEIVRNLIGCFNLDPNRVLDQILLAFECRPEHHEFYTGLLKLFPCETATISELLEFKISSYLDDDPDAKRIYTVIALLIQCGILQIPDVYDWLSPEDSSMIEDYHREAKEIKELVRKANIISTKDKDPGGTKDDKKEREREEEEKELRAIRKSLEMFDSNQKLRLMIAMLEIGDWDNFQKLSERYPEYYAISCPPVSKAVCGLIHALIEPLYRKHSGLPSRLKGNVVKLMENKLSPTPVDNFDDLCKEVFPIVKAVGPYINTDVGLMYKLLRMAKVELQKITTENNVRSGFYYEFMSVLDFSILPALSLLSSNPCIAEEVWECIKLYPYQHRYTLYGRWKNESYGMYPAMIKEKTLLLKKAKYIMMRVTKETVKPVSRGIGKLSHNNPAPIFDYILKQVQLYDNLITPIVDSLKYLTSLSYDVLGYCIVETLSLDKERTSNSAMAISPWLQSLSSFCGAAFKKFNIELGGVLQFVANQLKSEKSIDLLVLREIVQKMGGTDSFEDLTLEQLDAMCGGEALRKEAGQYQQERNIKRSSLRLKDSLIDNGLAVPLLLLMAQQRSSCIFSQTESPHLKLIGKLYDQCQDTLVQFGSYLFQMITIDELHSKLPPIGRLFSEFHLNADVAFFLIRPLYTHLLNSKYDELRRKDRAERKQTSDQRKLLYIEACDEVFAPIITSIRPHYNAKVWEDMDPSFFLTFWTLSINDLEVPSHIYDKEIKKIGDQIAQYSKNSKDDMSSNKRKKELDRLNSLKDKLQDEEKRQKEHVERVHARLEQEKNKWFISKVARTPKNDTVTAILQLCLFPRCTFTALDAIYCAKFVQMMHSLKTPNFSTLIFYDRMFCDITYTVASCTEQEAHRYARFLNGALDTVMQWHESKTVYDKECANYPGFVTKYRVSKHEANDYVDYENFRHVVHKWHYKITKAIVTCLESKDYIQIRNAIFILQGIISRFPAITNLSAVIEKRINKVVTEEKGHRNDLYVLANSYYGKLKSRKPSLLPEAHFHIVRKAEPKPEPKSAPTTPVSKEKASSNGSAKTESSQETVKSEPETNGDADSNDTSKTETNGKLREGEKRKTDNDVDEEEIREIKKVKKEEDHSDNKNNNSKDEEMEDAQEDVNDDSENKSVHEEDSTTPNEGKKRKSEAKTRTASTDSQPEEVKKRGRPKANGKAAEEVTVQTKRAAKKEEEVVEVDQDEADGVEVIDDKPKRKIQRTRRKKV